MLMLLITDNASSSKFQVQFLWIQGSCWGVAYKVPEEEVDATVRYLDHREKAGYTVGHLPLAREDYCVFSGFPEFSMLL